MKPKIIFFARSYHAELFPLLQSERYDSVYVTMTLAEKKIVEKKGGTKIFCLQEMWDEIPLCNPEDTYLTTSLNSDRFLCGMDYSRRIEIVKKEISFWSIIFDMVKPIAIINEMVAIEISEVLFIEAKKRCIKYLGWMNLTNDYFYWLSNPMHGELDDDIFLSEPNETELSMAKTIILRIKEGSERPVYVRNLKSRFNIGNILKNIFFIINELFKHIVNIDQTAKYLIKQNTLKFRIKYLKMAISSLFFRYDTMIEDKNIEYVLYPMHYEPEASLFYMSELFCNQAANIDYISRCLKQNQILIVKEHPQQPGALLLKEYRMLRKRISNLFFLPAEIPSNVLIKRVSLIVTLTSTLGWESIILGKPVVAFGRVFFNKHPDVTYIRSFQELKDKIRNKNIAIPDENNTIRYLAQLLRISFRGNPMPSQKLYSEENIRFLIDAIESGVMLGAPAVYDSIG